jgi:hypothetical protein
MKTALCMEKNTIKVEVGLNLAGGDRFLIVIDIFYLEYY